MTNQEVVTIFKKLIKDKDNIFLSKKEVEAIEKAIRILEVTSLE